MLLFKGQLYFYKVKTSVQSVYSLRNRTLLSSQRFALWLFESLCSCQRVLEPKFCFAWNHILCPLLFPATFVPIFRFTCVVGYIVIYSHCYVVVYFRNIYIIIYNVCIFILLKMDIWVDSRLGLLQVSCYEDSYTCLLGSLYFVGYRAGVI